MHSQSYLSFSGYQRAEGCLYAYWHGYVGFTPHPPDDRLGSIYGTVVGRLFEAFYRDQLWRLPGARDAMASMAVDMVDTVLAEEQSPRKGKPGGIIVWRDDLYASRDALIQDVQASIPRGLATIKMHRLLGLDAQAEVKLDSDIEGRRVGGRADFVMTRIAPHRDLVIIDGKGSRKRDRYVHLTQLQWYALLHQQKFKRLPDRVAFVYWHFDPPSNIDWFEVTQADVDRLKAHILKVMQSLEERAAQTGASKALPVVREAYPPAAKMANCRFCPYATEAVCPEGREVVLKAEAQAKARELKGLGNRWQA